MKQEQLVSNYQIHFDHAFMLFYFSEDNPGSITEVLNHLVENAPGVVPLEKITPNAIIVYGKLIPVERKSISLF